MSLRGRLGDLLARRATPAVLPEGATAPPLTLESDARAMCTPEGWFVLIFYPGDRTAGCTRQLRDAEFHRAAFESEGCAIFGINPSNPTSHADFARAIGLAFPLLADPGGVVARRYHAWAEPIVVAPRVIRTVYLVNPDRIVRFAQRGAPPMAAVLRTLQALKQASRKGR